MPCKIFSSVLFPSLQLQYDDKFTGFLFVNILKNRLKELVEEKVCYISTGKIKSSDLLRWKKISSTNLVHLLKTMHSWWMCFKLKFFIEQYPIQGKVLKIAFSENDAKVKNEALWEAWLVWLMKRCSVNSGRNICANVCAPPQCIESETLGEGAQQFVFEKVLQVIRIHNQLHGPLNWYNHLNFLCF